MGIRSFTSFGYSACAFKSSGGTSGAPTSLTTSYQAFPVTVDATNSVNSSSFPDDCEIQAIEFEFTARDSATSVTMYLARDSAGDIPITNPGRKQLPMVRERPQKVVSRFRVWLITTLTAAQHLLRLQAQQGANFM